MKLKLILLLLPILSLTACQSVSKRSLPSTELQLAALAAGKDIYVVSYDGLKLGGTDADIQNETVTENLNDPAQAALAGVRAGAALANDAGWLKTAMSFFPIAGAKSKSLIEFNTWTTDGSAGVETVKSILEMQKSSVKLRNDDRSSVSNTVEVAKIIAGNQVELIKIKAENERLKLISESGGDEPSGGDVSIDDVVEMIEKGSNPEGKSDSDDPASLNPNDLKMGKGNDILRPGNVYTVQEMTWKPERDGGGEGAVLIPYPMRAKSITVMGKAYRPNSISNGFRETWYGPKVSGDGKIVVESHSGMTYEWSINGGKRKVVKGIPKPTSGGQPETSKSDVDVDKLEMLFNGKYMVVSDYLSKLERSSNDWLRGKEANRGQGEVSNFLVENAGPTRHVFIRTSNPNLYELPNTIKAGHKGDFKIRVSPSAIHSYQKVTIPREGSISLASSKWLSDRPPYARVDPPQGWN
jgi:hypothetical protein